jgi:hypothetical protein
MAYLINLHDAESKSSVAADLLQWPSAQPGGHRSIEF